MPPWPMSHETEPKLMIEPPPASAIAGTTAWAAKNWWRKFTANRSSQYSGVTLSMEWRSSWAALLTRTRAGPWSARASSTAARSAAMSRRSQAMNVGAGTPRPRIRSTSAREASRWISTNATRARCSHRCSTMDAPMPLPPPVTNTARSSRLGYEAKRRVMSASPAPLRVEPRAHASTGGRAPMLGSARHGHHHAAGGRGVGGAAARGGRRDHALLARARRRDPRVAAATAAPSDPRGLARRGFPSGALLQSHPGRPLHVSRAYRAAAAELPTGAPQHPWPGMASGVAADRTDRNRGAARVRASRQRVAVDVSSQPTHRAEPASPGRLARGRQRERGADAGGTRLAPILRAHAGRDDHRRRPGHVADRR